MAKSLVEKYEQILTQDPASTVFVELAKALIEQGDHQRAISVCQAGLGHHQKSVVGRVLWGKALINLGRPAEAMEQFDRAIAIDRENPHAYNLIGEVLLHKGLYRSALPLLRKAVSLQPNDGRVRQWLEQTQAALAGGPAPILSEITGVDHHAVSGAAAASDPFANVPSAPLGEADRERTDVDLKALPAAAAQKQSGAARANGAPPITLELPVPADLRKSPPPVVDDALGGEPDLPTTVDQRIPSNAVHQEMLTEPGTAHAPRSADPQAEQTQVFNAAPAAAPAAPPEADPFANVPKRTDSKETIRGLTSTFDALEEGANAPVQPTRGAARAARAPSSASSSEPSVVPSQELMQDGRSGGNDGGLLGDIPAPSEVMPQASREPEPARNRAEPRRAAQPSSGGGLLDDIPDVSEPTSSVDMPKVELSNQATEAIAQEYERELREKLRQNAAKKTFLQKHGLKLAFGVTFLVAVAVGVGVYLRTRASNQGLDLKDALAAAKRGILLDTPGSYKTAFDALEQAQKMAPSNSEVWALSGYARAISFAEHGRSEQDRAAARAALGHEGVKEQFGHLVLAADYLLADAKDRDSVRASVISSTSDKAEVKELAGRALLAQGKSEAALEKLKAALEADPRSVRAMVALADYFLQAEDYAQALDWFDKALQISPEHPEAIVGTAEARLALKQDVEQSLAAVQAIPAKGLDDDLMARKVLAEGRLLTATGKNADAVTRLSDGAKQYKERAFDFDLALGEAARAAGQMEAAQKSFEAALKMRPRSDSAKEALGRILIARDRPREVLSRIQADSGERKVFLVRGVAAAKAGDWKTARAELSKTAVSGKVPAEAVIYLAMADAADGEVAKAQTVLERALAATKKNKSDVQVALGKVYLQQNKLKEAREQFEAASQDPDDEEGSCSLGQLLLQIGMADRALEPLQKSVTRNPAHAEARHALLTAQLYLGKNEDALKTAELGVEDNPSSGLTQKDYALALFRNAKMKDAEAAAMKATKYEPNDFEAYRIRAQVEFARGDGKDAFKSLERANKLNPKDGPTFCEIGLALMRQGHPDYAMQAFDAAKREAPDAPCATTGPLFARLPSASKSSLKELDGVVKSAPDAYDRALALATLSRVQLSVSSTNAAKKSAEQALELAPYMGAAHLSAALVAVKQKDEDKAKEHFAKAAELEPAWGPIRLQYADYLVRGNDEDQAKAVAEYEAFLRAGGSDGDMNRVKKALPNLKKKLATR